LPVKEGKAVDFTRSPFSIRAEQTGQVWGEPGRPVSTDPWAFRLFSVRPGKVLSVRKNKRYPNQRRKKPIMTSEKVCKKEPI
jgi:hypothetical protein